MSFDGLHIAPRGRDYLREAFQIARGETLLLAEREHLLAIIEHCRALTSAALELPPTQPQEQPFDMDDSRR